MTWLALLLLQTSSAASAPEPFDLNRLDDTAMWSERARRLQYGPSQCIEVQGRVRFQLSMYTPGGLLSSGREQKVIGQGRFQGRLEEGVWTTLETTWDPETKSGDIGLELDRFLPIVGSLPERAGPNRTPEAHKADLRERFSEDEIMMAEFFEDDQSAIAVTKKDGKFRVHFEGSGMPAVNIIEETVAKLSPPGVAQYVTWDEPTRSVILEEAVPVGDRDVMTITVAFPEGGSPTRLDATMPKRFTVEDDINLVLRDVQFHIRGRETPLGVVPGSEGMSMSAGLLGFTLGLDQRAVYDRVRACPAP